MKEKNTQYTNIKYSHLDHPVVRVNIVHWFTWMVEVVLAFESFCLLFWSEHSVETVLAHDSHFPLVMVHLVLAQQLHDLSAHCGLAETEGSLSAQNNSMS